MPNNKHRLMAGFTETVGEQRYFTPDGRLWSRGECLMAPPVADVGRPVQCGDPWTADADEYTPEAILARTRAFSWAFS